MTLPAYFVLGLATSLHCAAMCGGLVLAYSMRTVTDASIARRLMPHLVYHLAKIVSYAAVALVVGGVVAVAGARTLAGARDWLLLIAGVYMVLLGIGMTGRVPVLRRLSPSAPRWLITVLGRTRRSAAAGDSLVAPAVIGLLTGLMPCAPLIAAQIGAASAGPPYTAAALMAAFGLGTAPVLVGIGMASGSVSARMRGRMQYVAAAAVVVFGLVIVGRGLALVGSPVTYQTLERALSGRAPAGAWREEGGVATARVVIENTTYVPADLALPAGRPGRIIVDRRESDACSAQLAVPRLGVLADLVPNGVTTVDVPAGEAGTYTMTCGMGMMSGSLTLVP